MRLSGVSMASAEAVLEWAEQVGNKLFGFSLQLGEEGLREFPAALSWPRAPPRDAALPGPEPPRAGWAPRQTGQGEAEAAVGPSACGASTRRPAVLGPFSRHHPSPGTPNVPCKAQLFTGEFLGIFLN